MFPSSAQTGKRNFYSFLTNRNLDELTCAMRKAYIYGQFT